MENTRTAPVAFVCGGVDDNSRRLCVMLGKSGFDVSFTYGDEDEALSLSADIKAGGSRSMCSRLSDYSSEELSAAIVETSEQMGGIDLLVYMGYLPEDCEGDGKLLLDLDESDWDRAMNRGARGFFLACKYALPYLIGRPGGRIVAVDASLAECGEIKGRSITAHTSSRTLQALCERLEMELSQYAVATEYRQARGSWIEDILGA